MSVCADSVAHGHPPATMQDMLYFCSANAVDVFRLLLFFNSNTESYLAFLTCTKVNPTDIV